MFDILSEWIEQTIAEWPIALRKTIGYTAIVITIAIIIFAATNLIMAVAKIVKGVQ